MKRLTILRHAKSSWDNPGLEDFNRPLNNRGWKAARAMGRELDKKNAKFDLIIASPAARVRETIDGLKEKLKLNVEIRFEPRMYAATRKMLLEIVHEIEERVHSPLLVGHNPGLQQFLVEITHDDPKKLRRRIKSKFPTGALAAIEFPARRWEDIKDGSGEIAELILSKELD